MIQVQMSQAEFAAKAAELQAELGIAITANVGMITRQGVTAAYTHHADVLTIHIVDKPAFVSRTYCERRVEEWLTPSSTTPERV